MLGCWVLKVSKLLNSYDQNFERKQTDKRRDECINPVQKKGDMKEMGNKSFISSILSFNTIFEHSYETIRCHR